MPKYPDLQETIRQEALVRDAEVVRKYEEYQKRNDFAAKERERKAMMVPPMPNKVDPDT